MSIVLEKYIGFANDPVSGFAAKVRFMQGTTTYALNVSSDYTVNFAKNTITITTSGKSKLPTNGNCVITYPYCKSSDVAINTNSVYRLSANDRLTFYWKDNDDSVSYSYQR